MPYTLILCFLLISPLRGEKVYVVERERANLAVIENGKWKGEITGLGKLHHATVKFFRGYGYMISRDGLLSKIDPKTNQVIKQVKVGTSTIGLTFGKDYIAVANYAPHNVLILKEDLTITHRVKTGSRNVGIKTWKNYLTFSLMDKNEIWVLDQNSDFRCIHRVTKAGKMPFDAMLAGSLYIAGFFKDKHVGVLNLEKKSYKKIYLKGKEGGVIFKIPHFGLWGVQGNVVYIPAVREKRVYRLDLKTLTLKDHLDLPGMPVFVVVSPRGKYLAINYSGPKENYLTLVHRKKFQVENNLPAGRRILHFRFTPSGQTLYLSSYYDNEVKIYDMEKRKWIGQVKVPTPSGIFIVPGTRR